MSWGEVKKINSDISLPLNELFLNSMYLYENDENIIQTISTGESVASDTEKQIGDKYKMHINGTVRISASVAGSSFGDSTVFTVYKNGDIIDSWGSSSNLAVEGFCIASVSKGDVLYCKASHGHNTSTSPFGTVAYAYMKGTVGFAPNGKLFTITE